MLTFSLCLTAVHCFPSHSARTFFRDEGSGSTFLRVMRVSGMTEHWKKKTLKNNSCEQNDGATDNDVKLESGTEL